MRLLLLLAMACAAAAADLPKPDVPDPFGLGERLALIDDLRGRLKVAVPDDATYEQLVALYWANQPSRPLTPDEALSRDRVQRLRLELRNEHAIETAEDATEAELTKRLADARAARIAAAPTARAVTGSEVDDLKARIQRLGADVRAARARGDELEARDRKLAETYNAEKAKAVALRNDQAAYQRQADLVNGLVKQHEELLRAHAAGEARVAELEAERNKCELRLASLAGEAGDAAAPRDPAAPAALVPAPVADSLEGRLKAAVVLVVVANRGTGTGFFVTGDGLLVTNAHVLGKERQATALWDAAAKTRPVKLRAVQVDEDADLALLRAEGGGTFQPLRLAEAYDLSRPLLAVGYPLAGEMAETLGTSPSDIVVSRGILGAVRRRGSEPEWLQHDCAIASGSSGGPLLDAQSGDVIGVNSMVMDPKAGGAAGATMSFAIPIRKAMDLFAAHLKR